MKAIFCTAYGKPEVLHMQQVEKPKQKADEVLIKIHASAVTASDIFIRGLEIPLKYRIMIRVTMGWNRPRNPIIGIVLSGVVEAIGKDVKKFKVGDEVYGLTGFKLGCYAEYKCMAENDSIFGCLAIKPKNITHEEATAAAYGGLLALQYLEKGNLQPKHNVLIYGASGTSGTIAIQIAKSVGARVTAVCSQRNFELVKSLGADRLVDYIHETTTPEGEFYDLILDAVGNQKTSVLKQNCKKALSSDGKYVSIDDGDLKLDSVRLSRITELVEAGSFKPILDKTYPLERIAEAHEYVGKGHKKGGVAITIN